MGAEYCPYCAAERWSMIVALSRFGTFSGLSTVHSSTTDTPSNISTFTFHGSSYTSKYLTFTPVEMQTNIPDPSTGSYTTLQTPTKEQQALITKYDAPPYVASADAGRDPVHLLRRQVPEHRGQLRPDGALRAEAGTRSRPT